MPVAHPIQHLELDPLAAGNAVTILLSYPDRIEPEGGQDRPVGLLILRKTSAITLPNDPNATVVYDGRPTMRISGGPPIPTVRPTGFTGYATYQVRDFDTENLVNGTLYHYAAWVMDTEEFDDGTTEVSSIITATTTPGFRLQYDETDWETLVRERLQKGLEVLVATGALQTTANRVPPVVEGSFLSENAPMPIILTHQRANPWTEALAGDFAGRDQTAVDPGDKAVVRLRGRENTTHLEIQVWCQNKIERNRIARAVKFLLFSNAEVFYAAGAKSTSFNAREAEDIETRSNSLLYLQLVDFEINAPFYVKELITALIEEIDITVDTYQNTLDC